MRQWKVNPKFLCRKHLLGEHVEHHMFVGSINKGKSVKGFLRDGFLEPKTLQTRHDEIAKEMERRGYNHKSPLPDVDISHLGNGNIDINKNLDDLSHRCADCRQRIKNYENR